MYMSTITNEQQNEIRNYLKDRHIPKGLGTKEEACSVAAINLALSGELTDKIPDCMSVVIGKWIIRIQDQMPDKMRNSDEWRELLPLAAGTGREKEQERLNLILDWMWERVLPSLQPLAEKNGFGTEWLVMTTNKTDAARAAADAAAVADAADAVAYAADAARAAADAAAAVADAADAAAVAARAARAADAWQTFSPIDLLKKLVVA